MANMREMAGDARQGFRPQVREVWAHNLQEEVDVLAEARMTMPYIFLDTEFPGFLKSCPRDASEEECYAAVKFNVDNLKLLQLGITLANDKGNVLSWQFNLCDFNRQTDEHNTSSIEFLEKSGIKLERFRSSGASAERLAALLRYNPITRCEGTKWITFHGIYDIAYLVKLLSMGGRLPDTLGEFLQTVHRSLGKVYDVKHMAGACSTCFAEVGLVKLSKMLEVTWIGNAHQAGHDSLLTANVFWELKSRFKDFNEEEHEGLMYGVLQHAKAAKMNYFPPTPAYFYVYSDSGCWVVPASSLQHVPAF